jgi:large subunit ribosomal protein L6
MPEQTNAKEKPKGTTRDLKVPEGVTLTVNGSKVTAKGKKSEEKRDFPSIGITMELKDGSFIVSSKNSKRKTKARIGAIISHVTNMAKGASEGFTYKLKAVHAHFPMTFKVQGNKFIVENFLGSKSTSEAVILEGVKVEAKGADITVQSTDKEKAAQTAANIERTTYVRNKDRRVFQDGVFLVERNGVPV